MGELHIDIIRDRLKCEYGLETYLGPLNVNYRETPRKHIKKAITWNSTINERHATISITLSIEPLISEHKKIISFSQLQIIRTEEQRFEHLRKEHIGTNCTYDNFVFRTCYFVVEAINHGVRLALSTGSLFLEGSI